MTTRLCRILLRMIDDGCTPAQLRGVLEEDEAHRAELRARRAARQGAVVAPIVPQADSRMGAGGRIGDNTHRVAVTSARAATRPVSLAAAPKGDISRKGDMPPGPDKDSRRLVAVARKALNVDGTLPARARRACGVLLDCYNHESGRCDPGIAFIASALGVVARTVKRALRELEARGLLRIWRHQGRYHCNAYGFEWAALAALGARPPADVTLRQGDSSGPPQVTLSVTQTLNQNPDITPASGEGVSRARPVQAKPPRRPDPRQAEMLLAMRGGRSVISETATAAAERRLMRDLHARHAGDQALFQAVFAGDSRIYELAVAAELRRPESGLATLHRALLDSAATGPPRARAG